MPFRDEREALRVRVTELEERLSETEGALAAGATVERLKIHIATLTAELERARASIRALQTDIDAQRAPSARPLDE